jgi:hypothetical protein
MYSFIFFSVDYISIQDSDWIVPYTISEVRTFYTPEQK